jgi:hypothetical protein
MLACNNFVEGLKYHLQMFQMIFPNLAKSQNIIQGGYNKGVREMVLRYHPSILEVLS